jgi:hypothetical protein
MMQVSGAQDLDLDFDFQGACSDRLELSGCCASQSQLGVPVSARDSDPAPDSQTTGRTLYFRWTYLLGSGERGKTSGRVP